MIKILQLGIFHYEKIEQTAVKRYPGECCGILFGKTDELRDNFTVMEIAEAPNTIPGEHSGAFYNIDPLTLYRYEKEYGAKGLEVIGFFHSHPDKPACLSDEDDRAMLPGMIYLITSSSLNRLMDIRAFIKPEPDAYFREVVIKLKNILFQ